MKIKLVSVNGILGNPLYNESLMENEINVAEAEGVKLLIFPTNSIHSDSLDTVSVNHRYSELCSKANTKLFEFIKTKKDMMIIYSGGDMEVKMPTLSDPIRILNYPILESLEHLSKIERLAKQRSLKNNGLYIVCHGRSNESVAGGVYSNVKIIAYQGKILASNLKSDKDVLEIDFDPSCTCSKYPYLDGIEDKSSFFENILHLQGVGLLNKMKSMNRFKICMGVSGGLDSTVSLLACVEIFKKYGIPLKNIIGVTMPGLGTTERTYKNALKLMKGLGVKIEDIDLRPLLKTHLNNISQPKDKFDVTYEQTQSRERTQVLLDIANRDNAIMIGTGCMSEFALGWMTYGGDHLSMYAINIGLPKTIVKMYAKWFIDRYTGKTLAKTITDILEGPVSPELLPIDEKGEQHEKTESIIGDYAVQDFFIYQMMENGLSVHELFDLTCKVFKEYNPYQILDWLKIFVLRFFTRAYKKNCYGDGLQLFTFSVSPKHYHIPSDIDNTIWRQELAEIESELYTEKGEPIVVKAGK